MVGVEAAWQVLVVRRSQVPRRLGQEAAGDGGVGVERDTESAKDREEIGLTSTCQKVVVALVDGGENRSVAGLDIVDDLSFCGGEIGKTEVLELASRIDCPYRG